jgi:sugar/nucleoside kinase (ribokinase family)
MERRGVWCLGTLAVDFGKVIDSYPKLEHLAIIESISQSTGGPGLNMAMDLKQLDPDLPIHFLGAIGDDENGQYILDECRKLGIDISMVQKYLGVRTSFTDAMVEHLGGRRTFFHHFGSNNLFDSQKVDLQSCTAKILHVGSPGIHKLMDEPLPGGSTRWIELLKVASGLGIHTNLELVTLEPQRLKEVTLPCLPYLDSVIINEVEAGALLDIDAPVNNVDAQVNWESLGAMASGLLDFGVRKFVVIHTPAGVLAMDKEERIYKQGSVKVPQETISNTTGAGDAFASGVIYGIHEGWEMSAALELGVACAATSIQSPHTSFGVLPHQRALEQARSFGYRAV